MNTIYKELSEMTDKEYEAYLNGHCFALTHEKDSIKDYDNNLFLCFAQGYDDGKAVLRMQ